ncbi:hypothetical protein O181_085823 [Austropuccinia psidii MF-1]|uniref:Reverse transcriptase Ty1/copia-type domain-containing protein n=1 Tax=Austropuccinia psidii MF-1 TaxID=1389203 RepID=A0A9Q3FTW2_9BASI|nr:hypothetical protein [Austropuccinia psidii MF-1]
MTDCKPLATPLVPNLNMESASESEQASFQDLNMNCRSAIGRLSYLSTATRPDLCYAFSSLFQFLERPGIAHWNTFIHVLKYLKGTSTIETTYGCLCEKQAVTYCDADWGNFRIKRVSVMGYLVILHDNLIIWKKRKQPIVSLSSTEEKYKALTEL